jgi:glycosyltransferase involved in cell wall biosynthesis
MSKSPSDSNPARSARKVIIMSEYSLDHHYFRNVGKGLRQAGFEVVFGSLKAPSAPDWMSDAGYQYFSLQADRRWKYPAAALKLNRIIRQSGVKILHANVHEATLVAAAVKKLNPTVTYVLGRHYTDQLVKLRKPWHIAMDRWATGVADLVTTPCKTTKEYMVREENAEAEKLVPLYFGHEFLNESGIDSGRTRVRRELGLDGAFAIGCIARQVRLKGHEYLLLAFRMILRTIPNARLILVGGGDWSAVQRQAEIFGVSHALTITGERRDVPDCIAALDVVVHPSLSEAFCLVIIESMGLGKPVIATTVGGAEEVITDGRNGLLVPPADPDAIAAAVLRLFRDPELRKRIGSEAMRVRDVFTIDNMVKNHSELYFSLLRKQSTERGPQSNGN